MAAVHTEAATAAYMDWPQTTVLYDQLLRYERTPVIELNRAPPNNSTNGRGAAVWDSRGSRSRARVVSSSRGKRRRGRCHFHFLLISHIVMLFRSKPIR